MDYLASCEAVACAADGAHNVDVDIVGAARVSQWGAKTEVEA